jgi:hypothetical protein
MLVKLCERMHNKNSLLIAFTDSHVYTQSARTRKDHVHALRVTWTDSHGHSAMSMGTC